MTGTARSRVFVGYAAAQALAILSFFLVPAETWANALLQVFVGWAGAAALMGAIYRRRPPGAIGWYLIGVGVFMNATGILAAAIVKSPSQIVGETSIVDVFWLALYPSVAAGLAILIRMRTVERDWASLVDAAIITTGFGLLSWVLFIRPAAASAAGLGVLARTTAVAYPIGDLALLGMMVRSTLGGSSRSGALRLMVAAVLAFLSADVGWAVLGHLGVEAGPLAQHVLSASSMAAYALCGAAAVHPSSSAFAQPVARPRTSLSPLLLAGLTAASLVAPALLAFQVARHRVTDGGAIALCATILFLLVVARMAQLVRRVEERTRELAERNRAVRLVLDTVNEGLLRVSRDGHLLLERSAIIDRWFSSFDKPMPFADYFRALDEHFAVAFQVGYEALVEDVLPTELCLAQLPARLRCKGRDYKVSYLPVLDGERQDGLLVVFEDVTEQLLRAQQDAEQRELLAMFQALTRDKAGFLSFFDEASRLVERLVSGAPDMATLKRIVHTLKGNASMASLNLVARLCNDIEDAVEAQAATPTGAIDALHARWLALAESFRVLVGDHGRDTVSVSVREVDDLCADIGRGLPPAQITDRLSAWRDEPVERPLGRLADYARALAARLGKGELAVALDGHGVRLDPEHWAPLWAEMVHVVRNAVDHGLESPGERRAAGKEGQPRMRLAAAMADSKLIVEIEDDGRGIDWDAIRRAARQRGMSAETGEELTAALLAPGVSAREEGPGVAPLASGGSDRQEAERVSGRGVGMAAVATRVEQLGGKIELVSRKGEGTTWRFSFPPSSLARQKTAILPGEERSA